MVTNLGVLDVFASDYASAQARYEEAASIWRELGNVRGLSVVIQNLAIVYEGRGDLDRAAALLEESIELARSAANPAHIASTLHVLGSLLARRGDAAAAVPLVRESLELSHAAGEGVATVECLETLAGVAARGGDAVTGATLLGAAEAYREATGAVRQPDERRPWTRRSPRSRRRYGPTRSPWRSSAAAAPTSPTPSRSASGSLPEIRRALLADDERDRHHDDRRADEHHRRDHLVEDQPPEHDRHDRVDVRVGRDLRDRRVLQQPRVGAVRDPRAEHDQVGERDHRARRERGRVDVARLAGHEPGDEDDEAAEQHLPAGRHQRIGREADARGRERAARPHHGGDHAGGEPEHRRVAGLLAGPQQQRDAREPDEHGADRPRATSAHPSRGA